MKKNGKGITKLGTVGTFMTGRACSDTLFHVLNSAYDKPLPFEEKAAMPLAGGIMQYGYQCGMIWGATLAAGAQAHRLYGSGPEAEGRTIAAGKNIVESFRVQNKHVNCLEITEIDKTSTNLQMVWYFFIKGGSIGCFRMSARYAPVAFEAINSAFTEKPREVPTGPVSCTAMLAQKMGASAEHTMMAAGLAGGIGLSGGACGALGAAIWLIGLSSLKQGAKRLDFKNPPAVAAVEKFIKSTDYKFDCSQIVGRKFESIADHAAHLRGGGCANIIEALAQ